MLKKDISNDLKKYEELKNLILERQKDESIKNAPPYTSAKTDFNFYDVEGRTLLFYAIMLGDINKVQECIEHGADFNKISQALEKDNKNALSLALENGHVELADYIVANSGKAFYVTLASIKDKTSRSWLQKKLRQAISEAVDIKNYPQLKKDNLFFITDENIETDNGYTTTRSRCISPLLRAVELGDMGLIKAIKNGNYWDNLSQEEKNSLTKEIILTAARNDQIEIFTDQIKESELTFENFRDGPWHVAIAHNSNKIIDHLLSENADMEVEDTKRFTPLLLAIKYQNADLIKILIEKKNVNVLPTNLIEDTVLHTAVTTRNPEIVNLVLSLIPKEKFIKRKNIFGKTARDLALENQDFEIANLLTPTGNIKEEGVKNPEVIKPEVIAQLRINNRLDYFLRLNYRPHHKLNLGGNCNGWEFLYLYYSAQGRESYFFQTLELISKWDGSEQALKMSFENNMPQKVYHKNLYELMEQWINDLIWFQHTHDLLSNTGQHNRDKQYSVVGNDPLYEPIILHRSEKSYREAQMRELLSYVVKMPETMKMELGSPTHATGARITHGSRYHFYDSNMPFVAEPTNDFNVFEKRIINWNFILTKNYKTDLFFKLTLFCFKKDMNAAWENFEIFLPEELPKSHLEADAFQKSSPMKLTHLHVAVLTHSIASLNKIIKSGFYDLEKKDCFGRSALEIALENNFDEAVKIMLPISFEKNPQVTVQLAIDAYKANRPSYLYDFIIPALDKLSNTQVTNILFEVIKKNDIESFIKIIEKANLDINKPYNNNLFLIEALKSNAKLIIGYLFRNGANIYAGNDLKHPEFTPIAIIMKPEYFNNFHTIIDSIKDLNQKDECGKTPIHYATENYNEDALVYLMKKNIDLCVKDDNQSTIFDYITSNIPEDQNIQNNYLFKLFSFPDYNYQEKIPPDTFQEILLNFKDQPIIFRQIIKNCDAIFLNEITVKNYTLLQDFILKEDFVTAKALLEQGVKPNTKFSNRGNFLEILIASEKYKKKHEAVKLLLEFYTIDPKSEEGARCLELVAKTNDEQLLKIFRDRNLLPETKRYTPH